MPKRRRNPDGSLVVPLSEKQLVSLERGRQALASRLGELSKESGGGGSKESGSQAKASGGRRVEQVRVRERAQTKASGRVSKASGSRRSKASGSGGSTPPPEQTSSPGLLERLTSWVSAGE